jgi:hypothetical protein
VARNRAEAALEIDETETESVEISRGKAYTPASAALTIFLPALSTKSLASWAAPNQ